MPDPNGPLVRESDVVFRYAGRRETSSVRLLQDLVRPRNGPALERSGKDSWCVTFPRFDIDRMEYRFEVVEKGSARRICDPANALRAPGPFGDKSVIEFPGYEGPTWLDAGPLPDGTTSEHLIPSRILREEVRCLIWSPAASDPSAPLPLLVAHDGIEYRDHSALLCFLDRTHHSGRLPEMRAALLAPPGNRDQSYSASAAYGRAMALEILPALDDIAPAPPGRRHRVGMGASLGALAMLHVHRLFPASFGGLFLQSGSFFRQRFDKQEADFVRFRRVARFVGTVLSARDWSHPIPLSLACGRAEENLANNRAMSAALRAQDYPVTMAEYRDAHNWVAWRDSLDPHLLELLAVVWS